MGKPLTLVQPWVRKFLDAFFETREPKNVADDLGAPKSCKTEVGPEKSINIAQRVINN